MKSILDTLAFALVIGAALAGSAGIAAACDGANCTRTGESAAVYEGKPRPPEIELGPQAFVAPGTDRPGSPDAVDGPPENELGRGIAGAPTSPPPFALGKTN